jgi:predicted NBD/HSP70 family sugar kinase
MYNPLVLTKYAAPLNDIDLAGSRGRVLELLRMGQAGTRAELATLTGLSRGAISFIVADLTQAGFLRMEPGDAAGRGRPGERLYLNPQARLVLGIEVGEARAVAVAADLHARPLRSVTVATAGPSGEQAVRAAIAAAQQVMTDVAGQPLLGAGVAVPGVVDANGAIRMAPDLGWHDVPVAAPLRAALGGLPVEVANRAKAAAVGEHWSGAARGVERMLYLSVSTGISLGIMIDGNLYRGASLTEGELGHTTIDPDGPLCPCGNRGCLQTLASGPALLALVRQLARSAPDSRLWHLTGGHLERLSLAHLAEALRDDDAVAAGALQTVGRYLGIATANLINLFNPELVVLGGPVCRELPQLAEPVRLEVRKRALGLAVAACRIVPSALDGDAPLVGSAALLLHGLLTGTVKQGVSA